MNQSLTLRKILILFLHGLVGWGLCGGIIGIGRQLTSMNNTMIIHAIGVPIIFASLSVSYFYKFNYTNPLQTALFFTGFAIFMDVFVIAVFVEKSFVMFTSIIGTWIPFTLIFLATFITGTLIRNRFRTALKTH